jgi:hypothetical protein
MVPLFAVTEALELALPGVETASPSAGSRTPKNSSFHGGSPPNLRQFHNLNQAREPRG